MPSHSESSASECQGQAGCPFLGSWGAQLWQMPWGLNPFPGFRGHTTYTSRCFLMGLPQSFGMPGAA